MIKIISIVILGLILGIIIFLFAVSPGKTSPIIDSNGNPIQNSIAVIEKPIIGGIPQGIIIRGENINNPVLLYVHGGPGGPSSRYRKSRDYNDIRKAVLFCREYTILDKLHYAEGAIFSQIYLVRYMIDTDLNKTLNEQFIPVYIFQGLHDHQTSYRIAKEYFDHLKAPVKKFYTFNNSAHSPHIEEYDEFEKIVKTDVLGSQTTWHPSQY
jgi:hypothetical protein